MKYVEKDVIPLILDKRESSLWVYISFPWWYRGQKYNLLLSTFRKNDTPSKRVIDELLKMYLSDLLNFDYLKQYWLFDTE